MLNATGLPGLTATPQKTSSARRPACTFRTRSCGPTDAPPEVTSMSKPSSARSIVRSGRGERPDLRRAEANSRLEHGFAGPRVAAASPHVRACVDCHPKGDGAVALVDELNRYHRVGALRNDPTGRDRHRLAGTERTACRAARGDAPHP